MNRTLIALVAAALAAPLGAQAPAESQRLVIPLTDPGRPAKLEAGLLQGSISVVPGEPGQVVVVVEPGADADQHRHRDKDKEKSRSDHEGMRRITTSGLGLDAEEHDNRVEIGSSSWMQVVDLKIEVPPASSVELSTTNAGDLSVRGLSGELVLHNTNGGIEVRDVTGPVDATTLNGDVRVIFGATMAAAPMAFSTLNGDVDLTLPGNARIDVVLRSDNGEIFTDFDVALHRSPAKVDRDEDEGTYRVSVGQELTGKIGGGGPELFLKTFNGDILLRRAGG